MEDYYKILGVRQEATISEIKRAYVAKVKQLHPDKSGTHLTSEEFSKVVNAYRVLSDSKSRAIFNSSYFFNKRFSQKKQSSFDYKKWLLERNDEESWAKLVLFDLLHYREDEAVEEYKKAISMFANFNLKKWFPRGEFMDYGFILSEELVLRGEYYEAFLILEQIIKLEYSYNYFRIFFPEVISFVINILNTKLDGFVNDELALDAFERALELQLGAKEDSFILKKMSIIYKRIGDELTSKICLEEANKILQNSKISK